MADEITFDRRKFIGTGTLGGIVLAARELYGLYLQGEREKREIEQRRLERGEREALVSPWQKLIEGYVRRLMECNCEATP